MYGHNSIYPVVYYFLLFLLFFQLTLPCKTTKVVKKDPHYAALLQRQLKWSQI